MRPVITLFLSALLCLMLCPSTAARGDGTPDPDARPQPNAAKEPAEHRNVSPEVTAHTDRGRVLVLESHSVAPQAHERPAMLEVLKALGSDVLPTDTTAARLETAFGLRAPDVSDERRQTILASLKDAARATYLGEWDRATRLLTWVRQELGDDAVGQARQRPLFDALQQARIMLAECHARNERRDQAWHLMEEALRAQPDLSLPPAIYGPILQKLHFRVRTQLELQRTSLQVETSPPGALIFLSGRHVGISPVVISGLYQGRYTLLAVHGTRVSRVREVTLGAQRARIAVHLDRDAELQTGRMVGLLIPGGPNRAAKEMAWSARVGRAFGQDRLILFGVQERRGRRALVGKVIHVPQQRIGALAYVFLEPDLPHRDSLRHLGEFLRHGGTPGRGVEVVRDRDAPQPPGGSGQARKHARPSRALAHTGWSLLALGLGTSVGGAVLLGLDGQTKSAATAVTPRRVYQTGRAGYAMLGGGLGLAAVGAALLIADALRRPQPRTSETSSPRGIGLMLDGRTLGLVFTGAL